MPNVLRSLAAIAFAASLNVSLCQETKRPPAWAYGFQENVEPTAAAPKPAPRKPDDEVKHLPGSSLGFTKAQIQNRFGPADWFPGDHPAMPDVVAHGRPPQVWACSMCHYPNGKGRPENAGVTGLPISYFVEQMNEFRKDQRTSADSRKKNTNLMVSIAKAMTDAEIKEAADYFGSMSWTPWIKVKETATVPKTYTSVGMFLPLKGNETEPIGERIIEMPEQPEATEELRDPRAGFIAYVPTGSVERGRILVAKADSRTPSCGACHGADLSGLGPVPGIAGRSPSYLVRQLYDMQQGTRKGEWTVLMKAVVDKLSKADMLDIAAYTASQQPSVLKFAR